MTAMSILDKDWNMLGGWEDILRGWRPEVLFDGPVQRLPATLSCTNTTVLSGTHEFHAIDFQRRLIHAVYRETRHHSVGGALSQNYSAPACANIETLIVRIRFVAKKVLVLSLQ
jgi:hypothetical protein